MSVRFSYEPNKLILDRKASQISLGFNHMLVLTREGQVYGTGSNAKHQLGLGQDSNFNLVSFPVHILTLTKQNIKKIVAGGFSGAINDRNQILIWG
jgi:alpha-tubulin suppressor-like RCC1 family protein